MTKIYRIIIEDADKAWIISAEKSQFIRMTPT